MRQSPRKTTCVKKASKKVSLQGKSLIAIIRKRLKAHLQERSRPLYSKNYLQLFGITIAATFLTFGFVFGGWSLYHNIVQALTESVRSMPQDIPFNRGQAGGLSGYDDAGGAVAVLSSEIRIATSSSWLNGSYLYKKPITLTNQPSSASLTASSSSQVIVDTASLVSEGKLQSDCDDLRIVFIATESGGIRRELPRTYQLENGKNSCADSNMTVVTFPIQETLWLNGGMDTNYEVYYGNPLASAPAGGNRGYDIARADGSVASANLVCPLNGTTTCLDGETPTAAGAIRYSGGKSALNFDGYNDHVDIGSPGSLDNMGSLTWEAWIFPKTSNGDPNILAKNRSRLKLDGNYTIEFERDFSSSDLNRESAPNAITPNQWQHIAITWDGSSNYTGVHIYVNGQEVSYQVNTNGTGSIVSDASDNFYVGTLSAGSSFRFEGYIDEVRISNTVRYSGTFTPSTKPFNQDNQTVTLLHFDENGSDPRNEGKAFDASGNGNHGTIAGAKYVSGMTGVDYTNHAGKFNLQTYAGHQGLFVEESTANLMANPSFENASATLNWSLPYMNYATSSATFSSAVAKRNAAGPFAAGVMNTGSYVSDGLGDNINIANGTGISNTFKERIDYDQGSVVLWWTPEDASTSERYLFSTGWSELYIRYDAVSDTMQAGGNNLGTAVQSLAAVPGSTYLIVFRWDFKKPLDSTNHVSLTVNGTTVYGGTSPTSPTVRSAFSVGSDVNGYLNSEAVIEGFTIYRRPLYDGVTGVNVGNGNEIDQIYNVGTGKDPTLVTGSWDVTFALPTNALSGTLSTGTGNAWSHPHSGNLLGGNAGKSGFMTDGNYVNDGWLPSGSLTNSDGTGSSLDMERSNGQFLVAQDSPSLSITGDMTIGGWIKPESVSTGTQYTIAGKWDGANQSYLLAQYGDELRFYVDSSSNYVQSTNINLQAGNWYFVTATYTAQTSTVILYVNGIEAQTAVTGTIPTSIGDDAGRFTVGGEYGLESNTVTYQVSSGLDDGYYNYNSTYGWYNNNGTSLSLYYLPHYSLANENWMRFQNVQVPHGATITAAKFSYTGNGATQNTTINASIRLANVDDAVAPATQDEGKAIPKTTAAAQYDTSLTIAQNTPFYDSPDFSSAVQEVIDRPGWQAGNDMMVMFRRDDLTSGYMNYNSYEAGASYAPRLSVTYNASSISLQNFYDGVIKDVRLFNRVIGAQEIRDTMYKQALNATELAGLSSRWMMDEETGQVAGDVSGNANNATFGSTSSPEESDPTWVSIAPVPAVSQIPTGEKIYGGGYATSGFYISGMYKDIAVTPGQDLVVRGTVHSDGNCAPLLVLYHPTDSTVAGFMFGTNTARSGSPDVLQFSTEVPADVTSLRVAAVNSAAAIGTCNWHQVEVLPNMINNASFERVTGSPNPWIPSDWANNDLDVGDTSVTTSQARTGNAISFTDIQNGEGMQQYNASVESGKFYSFGAWFREVSRNSVNLGFTSVSTTTLWNHNDYNATGNHYYMSTHTNGATNWTHYKYIARGMQNGHYTDGFGASGFTGASFTLSGYLDDVYRFELQPVSLTVSPAQQADVTEPNGLSVTGADTLTQPVTGLSTTSGAVKFKFTPRHSYNIANKFGNSSPQVINLWSDTNNYLYLTFSTTSVLRLRGRFNGVNVNADWLSPVLDAGTQYDIEISYQAGGNLTLKVNDTVRATATGVVPFSSIPTTAYFGSDQTGSQQMDGAVSLFRSMSVSENSAIQYVKFGNKSVSLSTLDKPDLYTAPVVLVSNGLYAVSAYVYNGSSGTVGGAIDSTVAVLASGSASLTTTYTDAGGGWWRLSNISGVQPAGSYNYGVEVKNGKTVYVDGIQVEQKSYSTSYTDGGMGTGYSWSGTANNSMSLRSATTLQYPLNGNADLGAGAISFWMKPTAGFFNHSGSNNSTMKLIDFGSSYFGSEGGFALLHYNSNIDLNAQGFGGTGMIMSSLPADSNTWLHIVAAWDGAQGKLYVNNSAVSGNFSPHNFATNVIGIGDGYEIISDVRIYDELLSSGEISNLYYQGLLTHQSGSESDDRFESGTFTYTSPVIDLSAASQWGEVPITFDHLLNGGTANYLTRTSADNTTWSEWETVTGSEVVSDPRRYFQWKADMQANSQLNDSPVIAGMTLRYVEDSSVPANPTSVALGYSLSSTSSADVTSGSWYNHSSPKFTWEAGTDTPAEGQSASGIESYLTLLTPDSNATPAANVADDCYREAPEGDRVYAVGISPAGCDLDNGTYYLRLQTKDNAGNISDPVTLFTYKFDGSIPEAPASVSSTNVGYQATNDFSFYWPAAADNGPSGVKGYEYKTGTSSGSLAPWIFTNTTLAVNVAAYQEGQNYFYVRTIDNAGNASGISSNNISVTSFYYNASAPTAPRNLSITPESSSGSPAAANVFTAEWDKPATFSGEIARYYYCVNCTPSSGAMTETTAAETVNRRLENLALATQQGKNTLYIVAEDNNVNTETGHGNRNFEAYTSVDFYASTVAPGAPQALSVSDTSDREEDMWRLTLAWKAPSSGGTPSHYEVFRSTDNATFVSMGETTSPAYTDAQLIQSKTYYYKVKAVDNAGSSSIYSNTVTKVPEGRYASPPTAGGAPSVTAGSTTATVTWSTSRAAFGTVEYGKATAYGSAGSETAAKKDHAIRLTGLAPGTTYHYRVLSLDESEMVGYERVDAYSEDYSFTTLKAPSISEVKVTDVTLTSAVVTWKMSSITQTKVEYGETTNYGMMLESSASSTESAHITRLSGLKHSTEYHFRVRGTDSDQNETVSDDYSFTTVVFPKVTAIVFNTDHDESGTTVAIAWSTNTPTNGQVEYQAVDIDAAQVGRPSKENLMKMTQSELNKLAVVPKGKQMAIYTGSLEKQHIVRIPDLTDGSLYVFTVRGRDVQGNEAISEPLRYMTGTDTRPPQLSNVIIETPVTGIGSDAKAQIIISWETDEASLGQVMWGAGTGSEYPQATERDQSLTTKHVMVIRDLAPTSSYHLKIVSTDRSGNTIESNDTVVVTPSAQTAAFDVIINNLQDVFGFLKL